MKISRLFHGILDDSSEVNELGRSGTLIVLVTDYLNRAEARGEEEKKMCKMWVDSFSDAAFIDGAHSRKENERC